MNVGDIEIQPVIDGAARVPPTMAFTGTTDADWEPHRGLLGDDGMLEFAMGGFLLRHGDRVAVVDVGIGESPVSFMTGGAFLDSLAAYEVKATDVTDVIF